MEFLSKLSGSKLSWEDLAITMIVVVGIVALILTYFILRENPANRDPLQRIYLKFLRKIKKTGLIRAPYEGPVAFSERAMKQLPNKASEIKLITNIYTQLRYRSRQSIDSLNLLKQLVNRFR